MGKIIGIGNALVDVLVRIPDDSLLDELSLSKGAMQLVDEQRARLIAQAMQPFGPQMATGGCAGNTVLALAHLLDAPGFIGRVGCDAVGAFYRENCRHQGIDAHLVEADTHSGVAYTLISPDGERTFGTCLGAAALMTPDDLYPEMFRGCDLLHIEGYLVQNHQLIETVARMAKDAGLRLSIDLASANVVRDDLAFFHRLVEEYIDIVFANEGESVAFTAAPDAEEACNRLARVCEVAIVKMGSRGAMAQRGDEVARVAARRVAVADTTAAGDFFAAGFLHAYSREADLERCLECGALLAEHVIQVVGTRLPESTWTELNAKIQDILK